eukprot:UN01349
MIRMRNHTRLTCHPKKLRYEFTSTYYTYIYKKIYNEIHKENRQNGKMTKIRFFPKFDTSVKIDFQS